jgi:hypothetical protein
MGIFITDTFVRVVINVFSFSHDCGGDHPEDNEAARICSFWFEGVLLVSFTLNNRKSLN